ncbi:MAG: aromatic-ring-hydroxylating dioxygenase beta subunit, partial [Chloroflexi bacterium]|nr:aromatic-ring-hydroxylating dioxygenase beta subunit [Chloroflexota bacterium]
VEEAELLDGNRFDEWLELLTEDIVYRMPLRLNVGSQGKQPGSTMDTDILSENHASLRVRVNKLSTDYSWAESPISRTRHHISNVRVCVGAVPDELDVSSYVLVYRSKGSQPTPDIFSADRQDLLRRESGRWRLARRLITFDQAVVGTTNLSIFL